MTSLVVSDSLLVIDVGSISTRAALFDVVAGNYRFLASGTAPSTAVAPFHNTSEGVRMALDRLQIITGRKLIGPDEQLIMPTASDGSGVDSFAATLSAGEPLKIIAIGLLEDVSLESACHLANTTCSKVLQVFSLNDRRKQDTRINTIVRARPDLIIAAGGTENGASQSVNKLIETIGLACYLMPDDLRPEILFAGNQALEEELQSSIGGITTIHFSPNVRPSLDLEQLDASQTQLARICTRIRSQEIPGVDELDRWAKGGLLPTPSAFGRIIRFLSKVQKSNKSVLGIDVGASATTVAIALDGELKLNVFSEFGLGSGLIDLFEYMPPKQILRWLPVDIAEDRLREYLVNKSLYPSSLPATQEEMAIEQALARQMMQSAIKSTIKEAQGRAKSAAESLLPWFEPIVATGSVLSQTSNLAHCTLMLLDGLQPTGVTTLVLDQNQIAAALGAAAAINPHMVIQVLDSNSFLHLGTVISPVGNSRTGTPILRVKITYASGHESSIEVKQGSMEVLPLPYGQSARLHLHPLHRYDVGMGAPGRGGGLRVIGGALGVIIDARGRPLVLPENRSVYQELQKKWLWTLGAH
jgi:hypothetical protein